MPLGSGHVVLRITCKDHQAPTATLRVLLRSHHVTARQGSRHSSTSAILRSRHSTNPVTSLCLNARSPRTLRHSTDLVTSQYSPASGHVTAQRWSRHSTNLVTSQYANLNDVTVSFTSSPPGPLSAYTPKSNTRNRDFILSYTMVLPGLASPSDCLSCSSPHYLSVLPGTARNQKQETTLLLQTVLKLRFLVFDFGVYSTHTPKSSAIARFPGTNCTEKAVDSGKGFQYRMPSTDAASGTNLEGAFAASTDAAYAATRVL
eukprot:3403401-Rhodomonas_salina.2